ncbi:DUF1636 domain-containing protein [Hyphomicrobium sp. NDB2Meth4]|uniref:DUF1636 family protein n=1 Tax=Hyphomicrobium sp. NDB2Meth4 TaxID=1892846 RepID=UPI000930C69C|nr:DUF1636 domain-containing protein [Hyphomicrobium sp. NDB2Meth4]
MGSEVDIFVCISCRQRSEEDGSPARPGAELATQLKARLADSNADGITVREVECLAVCKRPSTIALAAGGKWTYVIGDLETEAHLADIVTTALAYQRAADGIVPWAERPAAFRKGVISRIPPLGFEQPAPEST